MSIEFFSNACYMFERKTCLINGLTGLLDWHQYVRETLMLVVLGCQVQRCISSPIKIASSPNSWPAFWNDNNIRGTSLMLVVLACQVQRCIQAPRLLAALEKAGIQVDSMGPCSRHTSKVCRVVQFTAKGLICLALLLCKGPVVQSPFESASCPAWMLWREIAFWARGERGTLIER